MRYRKSKKLSRDEQIYQISTMVAGNFTLQQVLDRLAGAAVKVTNTQACSIRLLDDETGDLKMSATFGLSEAYRNKGPVTKDEPVVKDAFKGKAIVIADMRIDPRVKYPEASRREGLVSQLTVALIFRDKPIGVLRLYSPEPNRFNRSSVSLARLVASQCAVAITNARLYEQAIEGARMNEQMNLAAAIQRRMIPVKAPCICGLDMAAVYQPCFQVGGDLYDFFQIDDHTLGVAISDVIGKGIPAAIMMSMFSGMLRAYSDGGYERHSLTDIVGKLNAAACRECRDGEFVTLFLAVIDTRSRTVTYCNCGHEPALLVRDRKVVELSTGGLVLGVMEEAQYQTESLEFRLGDCLFLYTDGLIDAMNFDKQLWGRDRLMEVLVKYPNATAHCLIHTILGHRRRHVGLAQQVDDTSIVAIRFPAGTPTERPPQCPQEVLAHGTTDHHD
jgi:phosphoserine phosphatase RsbU/P